MWFMPSVVILIAIITRSQAWENTDISRLLLGNEGGQSQSNTTSVAIQNEPADSNMTKHTYKLVYFDSRGKGEYIRLIFKYFDVDFEDKRVEKSDWPAMKEHTPMHQLPYLEVDHGKLVLCQTNAICRYLAKSLEPDAWFAGATKPEAAKIDMFVDACADLFTLGIQVAHADGEDDKEKAREKFDLEAPKKLKILEENIVKNGGKYLVGDKVTWADLYLITTLSLLEEIGVNGLIHISDALNDRKPLLIYYHNMRDLPQIRDYITENWIPASGICTINDM